MLEKLLGLFRGTIAADQGVPRSSKWPAVRAAFLKDHPSCAACGGKDHLQVHHVYPLSWPGGRDRELDVTNLLTLCEAPGRNCHLWFGHLGDFRSRNTHVERDAAVWFARVQVRPYPERKS